MLWARKQDFRRQAEQDVEEYLRLHPELAHLAPHVAQILLITLERDGFIELDAAFAIARTLEASFR